MPDTSPLTPSAAPLAVQDAFDRFYPDLVAELIAVCGSPGAAEAAVDEAFRRAAALSDFAEIGRPREWLLVMARNQVVRKPFQRDDLDGSGIPGAAAGSFERPSLAASLERARGVHRAGLTRLVGRGAAGAVLAVGAVFAATSISPWAGPGAQPVVSAPTSTPPRTPSLFPTSETPQPSATTPAPWPPPASAIVDHVDSVLLYTVESADTPGTVAKVWKRCRETVTLGATPCDQQMIGEGDPSSMALAVEVSDAKGHLFLHLLDVQEQVRPAFNGTFVVFARWGSSGFALLGPRMTEPKPFAVKTGIKPEPGQSWAQCEQGPCLVDLHGTISMIDLPPNSEWAMDTSHGWVGWSGFGADPAHLTVYIQQDDGTISAVDVGAPAFSNAQNVYMQAGPGAGSSIVVSLGTDYGFEQAAISRDRGRTWEFKWGSGFGLDFKNWESAPIAVDPALTIGPLTRL